MGYRDFDYDYFYIVKNHDTVSGIVKRTFNTASQSALSAKLQQIARLNPHIKDLNKVTPGTFIRLGVNANASFIQPPNQNEMLEMSRVYNSFSPGVKEMVHEESELLNYFGYLLKYADHALENGDKFIEATREALTPGAVKMTISEIRRVYLKPTLEMFEEVRGDRLVLGQRLNFRVIEENIVRITIDDSGLRAYTRQLERLGRIAEYLKWGGRIVKGVDMLLDVKEIYQAPNEDARGRTASKVILKGAVGGVVGAGTTYLVCNLAFGLESGMTSLLWCGAIAGGTGTIAGGKMGEAAGERLYENKWGKKFVRGLVDMLTIPSAY